MPGRVQMCAVMSREIYLFDGPALAVWQILRLQSFKELQHARQALLVIDVLDGRMVAGWIGRHVVLQWNGDVDQLSRHGVASNVVCLQPRAVHIPNTAPARIGDDVPSRHFIGSPTKVKGPWPSSASRLHRLSMWVMSR